MSYPDNLKSNIREENWNTIVSVLRSEDINDFDTLCNVVEFENTTKQSESFKELFGGISLVDRGKLWGNMRKLQSGFQQLSESNLASTQATTSTIASTLSSSSSSTLVPTSTIASTLSPTSTSTQVPKSTTVSTLAPTSTTTSTLAPTLTSASTLSPTLTTTSTLSPTSTTASTLVPKSTTASTLAPTLTTTSTLAPTSTTASTLVPTSTKTIPSNLLNLVKLESVSIDKKTQCFRKAYTIPCPVPTFIMNTEGEENEKKYALMKDGQYEMLEQDSEFIICCEFPKGGFVCLKKNMLYLYGKRRDGTWRKHHVQTFELPQSFFSGKVNGLPQSIHLLGGVFLLIVYPNIKYVIHLENLTCVHTFHCSFVHVLSDDLIFMSSSSKGLEALFIKRVENLLYNSDNLDNRENYQVRKIVDVQEWKIVFEQIQKIFYSWGGYFVYDHSLFDLTTGTLVQTRTNIAQFKIGLDGLCFALHHGYLDLFRERYRKEQAEAARSLDATEANISNQLDAWDLYIKTIRTQEERKNYSYQSAVTTAQNRLRDDISAWGKNLNIFNNFITQWKNEYYLEIVDVTGFKEFHLHHLPWNSTNFVISSKKRDIFGLFNQFNIEFCIFQPPEKVIGPVKDGRGLRFIEQRDDGLIVAVSETNEGEGEWKLLDSSKKYVCVSSEYLWDPSEFVAVYHGRAIVAHRKTSTIEIWDLLTGKLLTSVACNCKFDYVEFNGKEIEIYDSEKKRNLIQKWCFSE